MGDDKKREKWEKRESCPAAQLVLYIHGRLGLGLDGGTLRLPSHPDRHDYANADRDIDLVGAGGAVDGVGGVDLCGVDGVGGLGLCGGEQAADPGEGLVADDEGGDDGGLAVADDASGLVGLFDLGRVEAEDVVAALAALVEGREDELLGVGVELARGLADGGEALVELAQGAVAKRVGARHVGRDVAVGLGQVGEDGGGVGRDGAVGRVAQLERALGQLVGLDGVDAVADDGVGEEVLEGAVSIHMRLECLGGGWLPGERPSEGQRC